MDKLRYKWKEIKGLKCKRRNESPNCDKRNMALSLEIRMIPNIILEMREFSHLVREFTVWERSKKFGVEFSISWCSLFKWEKKEEVWF